MTATYQRFAGGCGLGAGLAGLVYLVAFLTLRNPAALLPALALLLVGLLASATLLALYYRVREVDAAFALWGLVLGLAGAGGAAVHAAFDLATATNPPATPFDYPSPVDPRGFLTFGVAGLGALVLGGLVLRGGGLPRALGYLGMLLGGLLVLLYGAYLIILNATNPLVLALVLAVGVVQPIWYLGLGWTLWQNPAARRAGTAPISQLSGQ